MTENAREAAAVVFLTTMKGMLIAKALNDESSYRNARRVLRGQLEIMQACFKYAEPYYQDKTLAGVCIDGQIFLVEDEENENF